MDISNPRRILAVSLWGSEQHLSRVIKDLTGSSPEPVPAPTAGTSSLAGASHNLDLKTSYYTATIPIWLDVMAIPPDWASSFLSEEAREVLSVLGGVVLVFAIPNCKPADRTANNDEPSFIRSVGRVVQEGLGGWEWDGVRLAVGIGEGEADEWEELCAEAGLEFVQLKSTHQERNEYGEKTGIARVREALESNDWAQLDEPQGSDFGDFEAGSSKPEGTDEFDPESLDFGVDRADFEGLRKAIYDGDNEADDTDVLGAAATKNDAKGTGNDDKELENHDLDDEDVAKLEKMMWKLQAAREMGEGMSETQRKRLAARAVEEVMREL